MFNWKKMRMHWSETRKIAAQLTAQYSTDPVGKTCERKSIWHLCKVASTMCTCLGAEKERVIFLGAVVTNSYRLSYRLILNKISLCKIFTSVFYE